MKLHFITAGLLMVSTFAFNQTYDALNLEKYWKFRNTFKEQFIKIGDGDGESLPASALRPIDCVDNVAPNDGGDGAMHWGDGMIRHGHYLALLATEYKLLKGAGKDVQPVLYEMYFALNAINRLDAKAENSQGGFYNLQLSQNNLNGFFIREDIPEDFSLHWSDEQMEMRCVESAHYFNNNQAKITDPSNYLIASGNSYQNVPSNDQISSLLVGLSLIHKLVDNIYVQPPNSENGFFIVDETKAIVDRIVYFVSSHNWQIIDVNGWPVTNGGGDLSFVATPILLAAQRITGHSPDYYNQNIIRRQNLNFGKVQHCITGYGLKDNVTQEQACEDVHDNPLLENLWTQLFTGFPAGAYNNQQTSVFQTWMSDGSIEGEVLVTYPIWNNLPNIFTQLVSDIEDDRQLDMLPFPYNSFNIPEEVEIESYNSTVLFNYGASAGIWTSQQAQTFANLTDNRYLELVNAVLTDQTPGGGKQFFQGYLNSLSKLGPYNLVSNVAANEGPESTVRIRKSHDGGWGSDFRWSSPGENVNGSGEDGIFNALDYMTLHNLYYIIYGSDNSMPEFKEVYPCYCLPEESQTYSEAEADYLDLNPQIIGNNYDAGAVAEANNNVNAKLPYLFNCSPNVLDIVSNTVTSNFDINPKFTNYTQLGIFTNKFLTQNGTVSNGGHINLNTRLILCAQKTLNVQSGGIVDIWNGELFMNSGTTLDVSGEVRIHGKAVLNMSGANGKIIVRNGGKLILDDEAKLIIDYGTQLQFYNGGEIINNSKQTEILLRSTVKLMNGGIFEIKQNDTEAGNIIIEGETEFAPISFLSVQPAEIRLYGKFKGDQFIELKDNTHFKIWDADITSGDYKISKIHISLGAVKMGLNSKISISQPLLTTHLDIISSQKNYGVIVTDQTRFLRTDFTDVNIYAPLYLDNGGKLSIQTCIITKNISYPDDPEAMVIVEGMGYDFINSTFKGKGINAISSNNLTIPSNLIDCEIRNIDLITNGNTLTGLADNSNIEIRINSSNFHHLYSGVLKNSGKLSVKCSTFDNIILFNLYAGGNCLVNISNLDKAGYNTFGRTYNSSIGLKDARININYGRNKFDNLSPYYIWGTLSVPCGINTDCSINAQRNQWSATLAPPLSTKFDIKGSDGLAFMVSANNTEAKALCGKYDNPGHTGPNSPGVNGLPTASQGGQNQAASNSLPHIVTHFNPHIRLDNAFNYGLNKLFSDNSNDHLDAISVFDDILKSNLSKSNSILRYYLDMSKENMKSAYETALSEGLITTNGASFDVHTQKYVDALNYMTDDEVNNQNYHSQFYNEMDKAHFFRTIGRSDKSIEILSELESCGIDGDEQAVLNHWKKQYLYDLKIEEFGTLLLDTVISVDTNSFVTPTALSLEEYYIGSSINTPDNIVYLSCNDNFSNKSLGFIESDKSLNFIAYPNPANNELTVELDSEMGEISLRILSIDGRIAHDEIVSSEKIRSFKVDLNNIAPGTYILEIINTKGIQLKKQIVVQK